MFFMSGLNGSVPRVREDFSLEPVHGFVGVLMVRTNVGKMKRQRRGVWKIRILRLNVLLLLYFLGRFGGGG